MKFGGMPKNVNHFYHFGTQHLDFKLYENQLETVDRHVRCCIARGMRQ
jgi:hypothetical protein